jgi:hypothetical protein
MTYHNQLPVGTLVTCVYDPHDHRDKPSYHIAGIVTKEYPDGNCWRILRGGWNHSDVSESSTYGMPDANDPNYHSFVIHTPDTFPYPELLI